MSQNDRTSVEWPSYVETFKVAGGFWSLLGLNLLFRAAVKGKLNFKSDIAKLRRQQQALDARLNPDEQAEGDGAVTGQAFAAHWISPSEAKPERVILYLHGGAFLFSTPRTHGRMVRSWCQGLNARALMVDYRLAPEHRWPASIDDCYAAYRWLLDSGVMAHNIVLAGDSAGANLSLALLHRLREGREPMPACAVLISPFVDFTMSSRSLITHQASDLMFTFSSIASVRNLYADPEQFLEPCLSPLFGDYQGFPPLFYQASDTEMLRDESLRSAERAHIGGVDVTVELWRGGLPHVFQVFHKLPQARLAMQQTLGFILKHVNW